MGGLKSNYLFFFCRVWLVVSLFFNPLPDSGCRDSLCELGISFLFLGLFSLSLDLAFSLPFAFVFIAGLEIFVYLNEFLGTG